MRAILKIVKYWPVVTNLSVATAFGFALINIHISSYLSPLLGTSIITALCFLMLSMYFKFCWWHRILIINLIAVSLIVFIDKNIYSFESITYIRIVLFSTISAMLISGFLYFGIKNLKSKRHARP
jgi:hypothetical protein